MQEVWALKLIAVAAQDKAADRKYPPYPDVWGYELPFPNLGNGHYYIDPEAYEQADGTIAIHIYSGPRMKPGIRRIPRYQILNFFAGTWRSSNQNEFRNLEKSGVHKKLEGPWGKYPADRWRSWKFTGEGGAEFQIERILRFGLKCPNVSGFYAEDYFRIRDETDVVVGERMFVALYDRPVQMEVRDTCPAISKKHPTFQAWLESMRI